MENDVDPRRSYSDNKGYALSGRIMLSSIVILFFVIILMVCLHLYARWYLVQARHRHVRRHRRRRTHFVFYVDSTNPSTTSSRGLDSSVLKSLPLFVYSSKTHADAVDCAVCLSEFEDNEFGRVLPGCNHRFHIGCIDMWFHSHSTCPLCRTPVELVTAQPQDPVRPDNPIPIPAPVSAHEPGSSSIGEPTGCDSSAGQGASLVSSFRRMLSREKKGTSTASGNDADIERGRDETQR